MRKYVILIVMCLASAANAQDSCMVELMVAAMEQGDTVPQSVQNQLETRLLNALTANGVAAGKTYCPFFVSGRFSHSYTEAIAGPPVQVAVHTTLTLYIGDVKNQSVFATCDFDLRGVGRSEERALLNAMSRLNGRNSALITFVEEGRRKIVDYFNDNYETWLTMARTAESKGNTDEALYYATQIPACSEGGAAAAELALQIYQKHYGDRQKTPAGETPTATPLATAKRKGDAWNAGKKKERIKIDFIRYK